MRRFRRCRRLVLRPPGGPALQAVAAGRPAARLLGLAFAGRPPRAALLLPRCRSVHTYGMRYGIDVIFLAPVAGGAALRVVAVRRSVPPRRVVSHRGGAGRLAVLELPARGG